MAEISEVAKNQNSVYEFVSLDLIDPNPDNKYEMVSIIELADSIKRNGLYHNLVLRPNNSGRYDLISGERRYRALVYNKEELAYAKIENSDINPVDVKIELYEANALQRKSDLPTLYMEMVALRDLYTEKRKNDKNFLNGIEMNEKIARTLQVSKSTIDRLERINRNVIPEFIQELLETKKIKQSHALTIAQELRDDRPKQKALYKTWSNNGKKGLAKLLKEMIDPAAADEHQSNETPADPEQPTAQAQSPRSINAALKDLNRWMDDADTDEIAKLDKRIIKSILERIENAQTEKDNAPVDGQISIVESAADEILVDAEPITADPEPEPETVIEQQPAETEPAAEPRREKKFNLSGRKRSIV